MSSHFPFRFASLAVLASLVAVSCGGGGGSDSSSGEPSDDRLLVVTTVAPITSIAANIIGGTITEINVTSPTGLQEINRFDDVTVRNNPNIVAKGMPAFRAKADP